MLTLQNITPDAAVPTLLKIDGRLMTECCCDESSVSVSEGEWPGAGWYCIQIWETEIGDTDCDNLNCFLAQCNMLGTEEDWENYRFGECQLHSGAGEYVFMWTTDAVPHDTQQECYDAGCLCS